MAHPVVVSTKSEPRYGRALDVLDGRKDAGRVSPNEHGLRRRRLLSEAGKQPWHWNIPVAVILGILLAALVVTRIIGVFLYAAEGL